MSVQQSDNKTESSLTAPYDRDPSTKWRPNQGAPDLTEIEVEEARIALDNTTFVDKFSRVDRAFSDPAIGTQSIGLISFIPSKGAKPDEKGVFGFAKLRGNYNTEMEASERAEFLIRNVDSYHQIFHAYVGRPFPITVSNEYSAVTDEIDIRKDAVKTISQSVKDKKKEERNEVQSIKDREVALVEDVEREDVDPYELYITLMVKKAQLSWTYMEHKRKMSEIKDIVIKTREELLVLNTDNPEFKNNYYEKYMDARKKSGLDKEKESDENFIKHMVQDIDIGF
jgi:hypothetical protein